MAEDDTILQNLQSELQRARCSSQHLSTLARQGCEELVQRFLTDNVQIQCTGPTAKKTQLYIASFWGLKDIVKQLLEAGTNPSLQNEVTLWSPLHAAAFQEHGPVIMVLLEHGAQPELMDSENRTPADFASVSDKIWPFFAALDIPRTPRKVLVEKGILHPGYGGAFPKDAGCGIDMAEYKSSSYGNSHSNNYMAAMSGDVLADDQRQSNASDSRHGTMPRFSVWK
ncbi:hypothetical protein BsWGS_02102 [Bradybaena similaris]